MPPRFLGIVLLAGLFLGFRTPGRADTFSGRAVTELEYLGENYRSVIDLPPLPDFDDGSVRLTDTTRFTEDSWLPGQRLELGWNVALRGEDPLELRSATQFNRDRFIQDLDLRIDGRTVGGAGWLATAGGSFRDEERSFAGHGDWSAGMDLRRAWRRGNSLLGLEFGWDHSATRGDTTSFVYDYDRARARLDLEIGDGRLPDWEFHLEGVVKAVPSGLEGAYTEGRAGARWLPGGDFRRSLDLDLTWRDYRTDGDVGRDFAEAELEGRLPLIGGRRGALSLEAETTVADYRGGDDIYYDFAEFTLYLPVDLFPGAWSLSAGPRIRLQRDLGGGDRDYGQWTARAELGRAFPAGGIVQLGLEAGRRDYAGDGGGTIELNALSTTILRSDYALVEGFLLLDVPIGAGFSIEMLADSALENHTAEDERIHVTFATVGIARSFP